MKIVKIPKRKGEHRLIYVPTKSEKWQLKQLLPALTGFSKKMPHAHGFIPGRSAVTNAEQHIGFRFSLCFDLKDFFDSVRVSHVRGKLSPAIIEKVFVDGAPRQGLPTSPMVANIAAYDMDIRISRLAKKLGISFVYTRYADDLSFSFNDLEVKHILLTEVPKIVSAFRFTLNDRKTEFQDSAKRARHITGIAVDQSGIRPTRKVKRKLRAAIHQQNTAQARGLAEWCKLKKPVIHTPRALPFAEIQRAAYSIFTCYLLNPKFANDLYNSPAIKWNKRRVSYAVKSIVRKHFQRKTSPSPVLINDNIPF